MLFKCKVCGGDLDIQEKASVGTCQYCGTKQTLPKLDDAKRANLYERANQFRRQNEFDKAAALYETILNEDGTDAEAYWSLVLCKYGVEYVEDPATRKRIPTCNRAQYASVLASEDYKQALAYADSSQRSLYEEEAKVIDGIQKGILEISNNEEPFDVFICYKDSDDNGRRTPDSVLAQDMYHQLTGEGFKVFFSRITLEDKIGTAYEPYIFAALQSSKIMLALGTKPEYFNAVWVKNEWSRYLGLIAEGATKTLIPAYRDMDPYGLPEEFSHLQAQDMGKLGFMQDLVRGIKKILAPAQAKAGPAPAAPTSAAAVASTESLMERAFLELEDGNWDKADSLLEQVLNVEPHNAKAYVGKLMAEMGIGSEEELALSQNRLSDSGNYQKALRFSDEGRQATLRSYGQAVDDRLENERKQAIYDGAVQESKKLEKAHRSSEAIAAVAAECRRVAAIFRTIPGFKDADDWAKEMEERASNGNKMAADELRRERRKKLTKRLIKVGIVAAIGLFIAYKVAYVPITKNMAVQKAQRIETAKRADEEKVLAAQLAAQAAADKKRQDDLRAEDAKRAAAYRAETDKRKAALESLRAAKYPAAEALVASEKYPEAKRAFNEIGGYKLGGRNWRILDVQGGKALIISEDIVEDRAFNAKDANVVWETCTLRQYLNGEYFNKFSQADRSRIQATKLSNAKYGNLGGNPTTDKIFLLSSEEAKKYFVDFTDAKPHFKSMEESDRFRLDNCDRLAALDGRPFPWLLRTPGSSIKGVDIGYDRVAAVSGFWGDLDGSFVQNSSGVRPAMWISLKP